MVPSMASASFSAGFFVTGSQQLVLGLLEFRVKSGLSPKERKDSLILLQDMSNR
jgi:hypothetical protein